MTVQALPIDLGYDHASLRIRCTQYQAAERVLLANQQLKRALGEYIPDIALAPVDALIDAEGLDAHGRHARVRSNGGPDQQGVARRHQ